MSGPVKPDEIPEIEREENPLGQGHPGVGPYLVFDPFDQRKILFQSLLFLRKEIHQGIGIRGKSSLFERDLKSGIDVSDVMDGDKFYDLMGIDLSQNLIKLPSLLTSSEKGSCRIKGISSPFERDDIASHLSLFFEKKDFPPLPGQEGCGSQSSHSGPDDDGIVFFMAHGNASSAK
jgi:hypothetical protein